jgi:phosphate starvation-inducible PhoH-like protein
VATETLHFENARVAQQLFNHDPRNLQSLETALGVKATSREGWIKLDGEADGLDRAKHLFLLLENSVKAGSPVRNRDFSHALQIVKHEGVLTLKEIMGDRITTSEKKSGVTAKTVGQKKYLDAIRKHDVTFGVGPAGTGKTYLAVAMAVSALLGKRVARIILTRPAVEAGEKLGFLPGTLQEKVDPYLRPLYDALYDMLELEKVERLLERNVIEVAPIAFMRGRTLNDSFIIFDEAQNSTPEQMKMVLTRQGFNSKMVVTGDITQVDLPPGKRSGMMDALEVLRGVEGISQVCFDDRDVVRHHLVQRIVKAYERYYETSGMGRQLSLRLDTTPEQNAPQAAPADRAASSLV